MEDRYDIYKKSIQDHRQQFKLQNLKRLYMNDFYQHVAQRLHCYEWAGLAGGVLVSFLPEVYIIETHNHAVNFDSENTRDFFANALFGNYRYPQLPCPAPVPIWDEIPINTKVIKKFYSKEMLESAQTKNIGYKRIFKL